MTGNGAANFDARMYCFQCAEPESIVGISVLRVDKGSTFGKEERFYFKPVGYCVHQKTAWVPLGVQGRDLGAVCRDTREVAERLGIKLPVSKNGLYEILESQLPDMEKVRQSDEFQRWKREHLKAKGVQEKPEKRFLSPEVQKQMGIRIVFDEDDEQGVPKYR
ncbi:MAG: hypothetical protein QW165_05515 [Candidatus Woesearchaeota archaeon]